MFEKELAQVGLSEQEITIYTTLIEKGELTAKELSDITGIQRTYVYSIVDDLVEKKVATKVKKQKKTMIAVEHPSMVLEYIRERQRNLHQAELSYEAVMPKIVSEFVMNNNRPGVHFYEGVEGFREVLFHSLKSQKEIYTFLDTDTLLSNDTIVELNTEYVAERRKRGVKKKIILTDSKKGKAFLDDLQNDDVTEFRIVGKKEHPFSIGMEIYDSSTSYLTAQDSNFIAILIDHPEIAQFHRMQFEAFWKTLE